MWNITGKLGLYKDTGAQGFRRCKDRLLVVILREWKRNVKLPCRTKHGNYDPKP